MRSECSLTYDASVTPFPGEATTRPALREGRAQPLAPQDRRESILDAAVPLFMAKGADVTTREIAEAACIAEGTIFRVFEDKQALIAAVVARFMDPAEAMGAIRVMATCMAMGEAAGRAAKQAVRAGIAPTEVDVKKLQAELREHGAYLRNPQLEPAITA